MYHSTNLGVTSIHYLRASLSKNTLLSCCVRESINSSFVRKTRSNTTIFTKASW